MCVWQTQEAHAQFDALLSKALLEGPQYVSKDGQPVAVLVSLEQYERETYGSTLVKLLSGLDLEGVDLRREQGYTRPQADHGTDA